MTGITDPSLLVVVEEDIAEDVSPMHLYNSNEWMAKTWGHQTF